MMRYRLFGLALLLLGGASYAAAQPYQLDGYSASTFRLARLKIEDRAGADPPSLIVPEGWRASRDATDRLRLTSPDRDYTVELLQLAIGHRGNGTEEARKLTETVRRQFEKYQARDIRSEERNGAILISGIVPAGAGGHGRVTYSLSQIWADGRDVHIDSFNIHVRTSADARPETAEIVRLFRNQLLRGGLAPPPSILDRLPPPRPGDRFDFRSLRPVAPFGFMSLRVPRGWTEEDDGEVVGYYDPRPGSPELWIGYHIFMRHHDRDGAVYRKIDPPYLRENESDDRRRIQWMISDSTEDRAMILIVDLFIEEEDADRPEFRELVQIVDEQLRRMRIGRPPADKEATIETGKRPEAKPRQEQKR
jgi:hypothetical protein